MQYTLPIIIDLESLWICNVHILSVSDATTTKKILIMFVYISQVRTNTRILQGSCRIPSSRDTEHMHRLLNIWTFITHYHFTGRQQAVDTTASSIWSTFCRRIITIIFWSHCEWRWFTNVVSDATHSVAGNYDWLIDHSDQCTHTHTHIYAHSIHKHWDYMRWHLI